MREIEEWRKRDEERQNRQRRKKAIGGECKSNEKGNFLCGTKREEEGDLETGRAEKELRKSGRRGLGTNEGNKERNRVR